MDRRANAESDGPPAGGSQRPDSLPGRPRQPDLLLERPPGRQDNGYRVLRGTDANNLSTILADTGNAGTSYTDSTVEAETTYHYAVVAMSRDGAGEQSGTITATTTADTKYKPTPVPPQLVGPRQGPSVTSFISNTGQTPGRSVDTSRATPFTTGAYTHTVSSVALYLPRQIASPTPVVRIYEDDSGNPGSTVVATLTNPTLTRNAVNVFTAPANTTLRASTTYWLVTTNPAEVSGAGFLVGVTTSTTWTPARQRDGASGTRVSRETSATLTGLTPVTATSSRSGGPPPDP